MLGRIPIDHFLGYFLGFFEVKFVFPTKKMAHDKTVQFVVGTAALPQTDGWLNGNHRHEGVAGHPRGDLGNSILEVEDPSTFKI